MQRILIEFSYEINGKKMVIQCEPNFPIPDYKEGLFMAMREAGAVEDNAKAQLAKQEEKAAEPVQEEIKEECCNG